MPNYVETLLSALSKALIRECDVTSDQIVFGHVYLDDDHFIQVSEGDFTSLAFDETPYRLVKLKTGSFGFLYLPPVATAQEVIKQYKDIIDLDAKMGKVTYSVSDVSTGRMMFIGLDFVKAYRAWFSLSKTCSVILKDNHNLLIASSVSNPCFDVSCELLLFDDDDSES